MECMERIGCIGCTGYLGVYRDFYQEYCLSICCTAVGTGSRDYSQGRSIGDGGEGGERGEEGGRERMVRLARRGV